MGRQFLFTSFLFLSSLLLALPSQAQHFLGVHGGVQFPTVRFDDYIKQTNFPEPFFNTVQGGVTYAFIQKKFTGFQVELNYSEKGWRQQLTPDPARFYENRLNYLELPITTFLHLDTEHLQFFVNAGPYVAYMISHKEKFQQQSDTALVNFTYQETGGNKMDFGLHVSGGIGYKFSFGTLRAEASFENGFANILKTSPVKREAPSVSVNQAVAVSVYWLFPLKQSVSK